MDRLSAAAGRGGEGGAAALLAMALVGWAARPRMAAWRTVVTVVTVSLLLMGVAVAVYNTVTFYRLRAAHVIATAVPVPFSMLVALVLAGILWRAVRRGSRVPTEQVPWAFGGALVLWSSVCAALGFGACAVGFPLVQIVAFGLTDYRRPADERGQVLRKTPYLVAREVAGLWVYYLRAVFG